MPTSCDREKPARCRDFLVTTWEAPRRANSNVPPLQTGVRHRFWGALWSPSPAGLRALSLRCHLHSLCPHKWAPPPWHAWELWPWWCLLKAKPARWCSSFSGGVRGQWWWMERKYAFKMEKALSPQRLERLWGEEMSSHRWFCATFAQKLSLLFDSVLVSFCTLRSGSPQRNIFLFTRL